MYNRLSNYLSKCTILRDNQYGFCSRSGTSMAVMKMVEKITEAIDANEYSIGIFIDLSKVFDTLNHSILCDKLEHYGIRGIALDWFKSYLNNRLQYVECNGVISSKLKLKCGVHQGFINQYQALYCF